MSSSECSTLSNGYIWLLISAEPEFREGETKPFQVFTTFTDITELKRVEKDRIFQPRLQELLIGISTTYLHLPADQLEAALKKSLRELGEFMGVGRFYLFEYDFVRRTCRNTHKRSFVFMIC